jgi:hypothetical protein
MKIYVQAKSKADINRRLQAGERLTGLSYSIFGGGTYELDANLPSGTIIAVYQKLVGGSPYTKAWGTWDANKNKLK